MARQKRRQTDKRRANERDGFGSYVRESRRLGLSITLVLPLVLLYQIGIVQGGSSTRNIAEVWLTWPICLLGVPAATVVNLLLLAALLYALWEMERGGPMCLGYMAMMVLESLLYALAMFTGMTAVAAFVHGAVGPYLVLGGAARSLLLLSLGAGVYEELLFRLLLIGGGATVLSKVFRFNAFWSTTIMLVASSVLFAAAHHVGSMAEPHEPFVFVFRALCGLALGLIFVARGLGVAVWTHALYNVLVLVVAR